MNPILDRDIRGIAAVGELNLNSAVRYWLVVAGLSKSTVYTSA